jgi:hypothetical protein
MEGHTNVRSKHGVFVLIFALLVLSLVPNAYSASLTTTFASDNGQDGNMFEIHAINTVVITRFDGNISIPGDNMRIYYKAGSYTGSEDNSAVWTLVGTANSLVSNGDDVPTPIPISVNVTIPAGQTYSFYITGDGTGSGVNYTNGTAEHAVYVSDSNIEILQGIGIAYPFGLTFSPRIWNGTVYYNSSSSAATAAPTMTEWGMIMFIALAGLGAVYYLRKQKMA